MVKLSYGRMGYAENTGVCHTETVIIVCR